MSKMNYCNQMRSWGAVCGLLLGSFVLAGCSSVSPDNQFADVPVMTASATGAVVAPTPSNMGPEIFNIGDSLTIVFSDLAVPVPAFEERVKEDGTITLIENQNFT